MRSPSLLVVADQMTSSLPVQAAAASGAIAPTGQRWDRCPGVGGGVVGGAVQAADLSRIATRSGDDQQQLAGPGLDCPGSVAERRPGQLPPAVGRRVVGGAAAT